jgi:hypothetical protein
MSLLTTLISSKIAAGVLAVGSIAVGGTAAVACTGGFSEALQPHALSAASPSPSVSLVASDVAGDDAEDATSTPAPTLTPEPTLTPAPTLATAPLPLTSTAAKASGPKLQGPAAHGLCTAFTHGGLSSSSVAYGALVTVAGGSANISSWCAPYLVSTKAKHSHVNKHSGAATTTPEADDSSADENKAGDDQDGTEVEHEQDGQGGSSANEQDDESSSHSNDD